MNIYLPLEVQQRELDARVYLAANLAALGHTAYFGHKSNLFPQIKKLKPGVFIHKSIQIRKIKQILLLKDLGHVNLAFDEEALMIPDIKAYFNWRASRKCLSAVDQFFTWGKYDYNLFVKQYPDLSEKVKIGGNSRIDVLSDQSRFLEEANYIKAKHGKFVLFITKFARYNLKKRGWDTFLEMTKANNPNVSAESVQKIEQSVLFEEKNMISLQNVIKKLATTHPDLKIIIRPHPAEDHEKWISFSNTLNQENVLVDSDNSNSVVPWILAAHKVISHNCTTSIESFVLGISSGNFISFRDAMCEYDPPKYAGVNLYSEDELFKFVLDESSGNDLNLKITDYLHFCDSGRKFHDELSDYLSTLSFQGNLKNFHYSGLLLLLAKAKRIFLKFASQHFGKGRRRRQLANQKFAGFTYQQVCLKKTILCPTLKDVSVTEVWPGVFCFKKVV